MAAFLYLATGIAVVVGVSLLFPSRLMDRLWGLNRPGAALFRALGRASGLGLLALAMGTAAAARGLLRGRKWAWWLTVVLFSIDACGDVAASFATGEWWRSAFGVAVSLAFLYALSRGPVRRYYRR